MAASSLFLHQSLPHESRSPISSILTRENRKQQPNVEDISYKRLRFTTFWRQHLAPRASASRGSTSIYAPTYKKKIQQYQFCHKWPFPALSTLCEVASIHRNILN
ncbi:hypothetical protein MTR_6g084180 [Medicago truncatula]|uniref:Uncharacterized protein n=1 Tax=Medicago truncatula TaxID=3880 RepID=G7KN18_MEDTR|nr:hypothetical protein MTR_6g084180 [Medicago truncatula]